MNRRKAIRWSALAGIIAGTFNPLVDLLAPKSDSPLQWGYFIGGVALQLTLIGIYTMQVKESGAAGFLGTIMAFTGRAYFSVPAASIGGVDGTVPLGSLYALGLILLAVGSLRAGKLPRWVPAMWIVGVVVGVAGAIVPSIESLSMQLGALAVGLGFAGAGYALWVSNPIENR